MKSSRVRSSRHGRYQAADESVFLQVTMLLVKGGLGFLAVVLAGVALMNYRILLHHDGQVEFARKTEWTLADSFRFIPEETQAPIATVASLAPPAPPAAVVARAIPPPAPVIAPAPSVKAPAPVVAHVAHPAPARPVKPSPAPQLLARAKPAPLKPQASSLKPSEDEEQEDPISAVLSTVRPVEPANPEAADCRRIRGKLKAAVARMDAKYPAQKARELRVFDLIQEGYLDSLQSCPAMGGYQLQRKNASAEIRCTVHGSI